MDRSESKTNRSGAKVVHRPSTRTGGASAGDASFMQGSHNFGKHPLMDKVEDTTRKVANQAIQIINQMKHKKSANKTAQGHRDERLKTQNYSDHETKSQEKFPIAHFRKALAAAELGIEAKDKHRK